MQHRTASENHHLDNNTIKQQQEDKRAKLFIQLLDVKQDTNMTRVYSAMQSFKKQKQ